MDKRGQTCCFTGHRVIEKAAMPYLAQLLETTLRLLVKEGYCYFGAGGALGFDTLAAQTVLRLRQEFPHIRLILVLPCRDQAKGWPPEDTLAYQNILQRADKQVYISNNYTQGCMHRRNRHLVDNSSACIAYCTHSSGGSAYTVRYACQQGLRVIRLDNMIQA